MSNKTLRNIGFLVAISSGAFTYGMTMAGLRNCIHYELKKEIKRERRTFRIKKRVGVVIDTSIYAKDKGDLEKHLNKVIKNYKSQFLIYHELEFHYVDMKKINITSKELEDYLPYNHWLNDFTMIFTNATVIDFQKKGGNYAGIYNPNNDTILVQRVFCLKNYELPNLIKHEIAHYYKAKHLDDKNCIMHSKMFNIPRKFCKPTIETILNNK